MLRWPCRSLWGNAASTFIEGRIAQLFHLFKQLASPSLGPRGRTARVARASPSSASSFQRRHPGNGSVARSQRSPRAEHPTPHCGQTKIRIVGGCQTPAARCARYVLIGAAGHYFGRTNRNPFGRSDRSLLNQAFGGTALKRSRGHPSSYKPKSHTPTGSGLLESAEFRLARLLG